MVHVIPPPGDNTFEKLPFYAAHELDEILILDPAERSVASLALDGDTYRGVARSALIGLTAADLAARLDWH